GGGPVIQAFRRAAALSLLLMLVSASPAAAQDEPAAPMTPPPAPLSPEEAAGQVALPRIDELQYPSTEELLRGPARDWTVLVTDEVIVSESIAPRPNTLEQLETAHKAKEKERRGKTGAELELFR